MAEAKQISLLEQTVVDVINKSVSSIEKGAEFLAGQLPDIAEQYLRWKLTWSFVELGIFLLALFVIHVPIRGWYSRRWNKEKQRIAEYNESLKSSDLYRWQTYKKEADWTDIWTPYVVIGGVVSFFCFCGVCANLYSITYIYVAPKVYLIEWAKSFL